MNLDEVVGEIVEGRAADYQEHEYTLLGMAIKYAGLRGKEVPVIGKNRSSLGEEERIQ
jgi:hypothetical protein